MYPSWISWIDSPSSMDRSNHWSPTDGFDIAQTSMALIELQLFEDSSPLPHRSLGLQHTPLQRWIVFQASSGQGRKLVDQGRNMSELHGILGSGSEKVCQLHGSLSLWVDVWRISSWKSDCLKSKRFGVYRYLKLPMKSETSWKTLRESLQSKHQLHSCRIHPHCFAVLASNNYCNNHSSNRI